MLFVFTTLFLFSSSHLNSDEISSEFKSGYDLAKGCFETSTNKFENNKDKYDYESCILSKEKNFTKEDKKNNLFLLGFNYSAFNYEELRLILQSLNGPFDTEMVKFALNHYTTTRDLQKKLRIDNTTLASWLSISKQKLEDQFDKWDNIKAKYSKPNF
ncbi:hypothetical protein Thena_1538 [Thermodesulfobium narugense DSM 14796]|uniref:Uncharacterized protein n=1 Tax=Thermodesulfobium narugense DSM 14796 TaxID=747365 RepID=M1E8T7_9BACT|nr:hypothetical protein [Thermodesulfobium narugense]AEE15150.1 hypothetical protein Thena_1538 [Thermodesulfobium narugense DSM 14796]